MEPMDTNKKTRELVSALMDDALPEGDVELALAALGTPAGETAWRAYHLVGDALRDGDRARAVPELSPGFGTRLAARLAAEPVPGKRGAAEPAGAANQAEAPVLPR